MTDGQILLTAVAVLTLYECARWVPAHAWIFTSQDGQRWKGTRPWERFRARGGGIALLPPLPAPGLHLTCTSWPCAPHEKGLCVWSQAGGIAKVIPWAEAKPVAHGAVLRLATGLECRCANARSAWEWARLTDSWKSMSAEEREASFAVKAQQMLDATRMKAEVEKLAGITKRLRLVGAIILGLTFILMPAVYWRFGDHVISYGCLGVLVAFTLTQACLLVGLVRNHAELRKDSGVHILSAAFFPPSAMRAADWVCAGLGPDVHPLTAHLAWSARELFLDECRRAWRICRWPGEHVGALPWEGPEVRALKTFFQDNQIPVEDLEVTPERQPECTQYCPRCQAQYLPSAGTRCPDCVQVPLVAWP